MVDLDLARQRADGQFSTVRTDRKSSTMRMIKDHGHVPDIQQGVRHSPGDRVVHGCSAEQPMSASNSRAGAVDEPCEQQADDDDGV